MIEFRCWFCNRAYLRPDGQAGMKFECGCRRRLKVPRRSRGSSKARSPLDWLAESVVYGGAGALFGFFLSFAIFTRIPLIRRPSEVVLAMTALGLCAGVLFGERGINWLGQRLRDRASG